MATHFSISAWKISWTEEFSRLQSMGSKRVGYDWVHTYIHPGRFFIDIEKLILNFVRKFKVTMIAKTILKKNKLRRITLPNDKIYYIDIANWDSVILEEWETQVRGNKEKTQKQTNTNIPDWFLTKV